MSDDSRERGPLEKAAELSLERAEDYLERVGEPLRMMGDGPMGITQYPPRANDALDNALMLLDEIREEYGLHHASLQPSLEKRVAALEKKVEELVKYIKTKHEADAVNSLRK